MRYGSVYCFAVLLSLCAVFLAGCGTPAGRETAKTKLPPPGAFAPVESGVMYSEVTLPGKPAMKLGVYLPTRAATGESRQKLGCVFVAPAGTPLIHGMKLGDGDRPEHLPYVRAGYAVVAYEIDGDVPENASDPVLLRGVQQFLRAEGGVANARAAMDYAAAKLPQIDPNRFYVAGHSSAATLALQAAAADPRVKACMAYAPCTDLRGRLGDDAVKQLSQFAGGLDRYVTDKSPLASAAKVRCPLFLFHADDDSNVPVAESVAFAAAVRKTNPNVTLARVPTGDHYQPMITTGIPAAIAWLGRVK